MALSNLDISRVLAAGENTPFDFAELLVEDFFASILGLNAVEKAAAFPDPDPQGLSAISVSWLTRAREEILRDKCQIPSFVVYEDAQGRSYISGLMIYLRMKGIPQNYPIDFLDRLRQHKRIRDALVSLDQGHKLELVAAALFASACDFGEATRGSGDQGVDAIAWNRLIEINDAFIDGAVETKRIRPGQKVMIIASSKATISQSNNGTKLISPAHIRELVGSWLIQRSESGMWRNMGIQMLTPIQLVLVTTYRLSEDSKAECQNLGVQVWGIPELIFLICRYAPSDIFKRAGQPIFSGKKFSGWWEAKEQTKIHTVF